MKLQSGTTVDNGWADTAWKLKEGSGERVFTRAVTFESKFANPPKVVIGLNGLDVGSTKNNRVVVTAKNITDSGFQVEYKTWSDTILYAVWANWLAYGD